MNAVLTTRPSVHRFQIGDLVRYHRRTYRVLSSMANLIAGPHYRLGACGDYPNEDLTSLLLLTRVAAETERERAR